MIPPLRERLLGPKRVNAPMLCLLAIYHVGGWTALAGRAPSEVLDALGDRMHWAWIVMLLTGPVITIVGLGWHNPWVGAWLRVAGGCSILGALTVDAVALAATDGVTFAMWMSVGLSLATLCLLADDIVGLRRPRYRWQEV